MNPSTATAMFAPDHRRPRSVRSAGPSPSAPSWRARLRALLLPQRNPLAR